VKKPNLATLGDILFKNWVYRIYTYLQAAKAALFLLLNACSWHRTPCNAKHLLPPFCTIRKKAQTLQKNSVKTWQNNLISPRVIIQCNTQTSAERVEKPGNRYTAHTPIKQQRSPQGWLNSWRVALGSESAWNNSFSQTSG